MYIREIPLLHSYRIELNAFLGFLAVEIPLVIEGRRLIAFLHSTHSSNQ
jgi:hypothetical protein